MIDPKTSHFLLPLLSGNEVKFGQERPLGAHSGPGKPVAIGAFSGMVNFISVLSIRHYSCRLLVNSCEE